MGKTDTFWAIRFPGLKSLPIAQMNREIERLRRNRPDLAEEEKRELDSADRLRAVLLAGPYPDLSAGAGTRSATPAGHPVPWRHVGNDPGPGTR
jgi:hypothetical protein